MFASKILSQKTVRAFAAVLLAGALGAGVLAGCASDNAGSAADDSTQGAQQSQQDNAQAADAESGIAITVLDNVNNKTLASDTLEYTEGETVLDALNALGLDVTVEDSQYGAYVSAIDGLAGEGMTGWTYTVNGEMLSVSAGDAVLQPGDVVEWSYIDMSE